MALAMKQLAKPTVAARASRRTAVCVRASRPMWYPGATAPKHLDGSMRESAGKRQCSQ